MIAPANHDRLLTRPERGSAIAPGWSYELPESAGAQAVAGVRKAIGEHPVVAIASAAAIGLAAAWLLKRKGH